MYTLNQRSNIPLHAPLQGRSQDFSKGGGWNYGSKSYEKEKLLVIRIARKARILWINSWLYSLGNLGSFQLNCHLVSLIFFHDDRKTQPPWLHDSAEFCFDLWFFSMVGKHISHVHVFFIFASSFRNASNFPAQNWWYWLVWWDFNLLSPFSNFCEMILPTCQGS